MNTSSVSNLSIKNWSKDDQPIQRMQSLGTQSLSDAELLAVLIGSGTKGRSAVEIARDLLAKVNNSLNAIGKARLDEITSVEGIGLTTACRISAAIEIGKRRTKTDETPDLGTAVRIYNFMLPIMKDLDTEEFHIILMNQNFHFIKRLRISKGGISETAVDIRIIIREAVLNNATILACCHNHPSGSLRPSRADEELTRSIKNACQLMRIHFLDHVIVTDGAYYSFHEEGKI